MTQPLPPFYLNHETQSHKNPGLVYKRPEERNTHDAVELLGGVGGSAITIHDLDALVLQVRVCVAHSRVS